MGRFANADDLTEQAGIQSILAMKTSRKTNGQQLANEESIKSVDEMTEKELREIVRLIRIRSSENAMFVNLASGMGPALADILDKAGVKHFQIEILAGKGGGQPLHESFSQVCRFRLSRIGNVVRLESQADVHC